MSKKYNRFIIAMLVVFCLSTALVVLIFVRNDNGKNENNVAINRVKNYLKTYENENGKPCTSYDNLLADKGLLACIEDIFFVAPGDRYEEDYDEGEIQGKYVFGTEHGIYVIEYEYDDEGRFNMLFLALSINVLVCGFVIFILLYIKKKIIVPFESFSELPYELSKGRLTVPVKQEKSRYFNRFLWGMDLLRESIEDGNRRQLEIIRDKKVLLLSLAHDLRTPLSVIKLYSTALLKNLYKSEEKKKQIAEGIGKNVDEIEAYISQITKASNEEFMDFTVNNRYFYLKEVFDYLKNYYVEKMRISQIDFRIGEYPELLVFGDSERTVEIIQNMIENAIKYGDGRRIYVETQSDSDSVTISVHNTGCELADNELPHIFDSFFRGSNVGSRNGSGLGLHICRELAGMMEGCCSAGFENDEDGKNMRVSLTLHK